MTNKGGLNNDDCDGNENGKKAVGLEWQNTPGAPNDNFRKNICSEDDLRARIFETFVVKFLACLLFLGFSNI